MRKTYSKEAHVKDDVKKILDAHGWFWWMPPSNGYGKSGISDFHAFRNGIFMVVETKFGSNKPTPQQIGFLNSIRQEGGDGGGFAFVVSDRTLPHFAAFMESFDVSIQCAAKREKIPDEHGARMLDAIHELSNKLLDTAGPPASAVEVEPAGAN